MIQRDYSSRPGITLIEVLAAIFIMGVGMLALFTLFPLGALSMARAVRDDRAAAIAGNAASLATVMKLPNDDAPLGSGIASSMSDKFTPPPPPPPWNGFFSADPNKPGYPVLVDPTYVNLGKSSFGSSVVGVPTPGLQRMTPSYAPNSTEVARLFTFLDEMTFENTGQPRNSPTSVERPGTYTWSYLLRRQKSSVPDLVQMSVLIYANRAVDIADGETTFPRIPSENVTTAASTNPTSVMLTYAAGAKPNVRRGTWIMDVTYNQTLASPPNTPAFGSVNGFAYRVETVTESGGTTLTLEVDPVLKADIRTLVILDNVIAIVDRGTIRAQ